MAEETKKDEKKKRIGLYWKVILCAACMIAVFFLLSFIKSFDDWYVNRIFVAIHRVNAQVFNLFPFAVGEIIMYAGAVLVAVTVVVSLVIGIWCLISKIFHKKYPLIRVYTNLLKTVLAAAVLFLWLYLFHWWIPYNGHVLGEKGVSRDSVYTIEEIHQVKILLEKQISWAQQNVPRNADGRIVYPDKKDAFDEIITAMRNLSDRYPRLKGYYGRPKAALCSDVLEWMYIGGYTYPYTMEITYNKYVDNFYWYALIAHETAHYKGFYKENEGSFIGFLACATSDDPLMVYSGCTDVYFNICNAYADALVAAYGEEEGLRRYLAAMNEDPGFDWDLYYADEQDAVVAAQEAYEADEHPLQEYSETAAEVADTGWEVQENAIAENGYDDVTRLILEYYRQNGTEE